MKKILFILFALVAFNSQAQNPLVGKPSLKLVYETAQTNKWEFTVGSSNTLTIDGTGGTPVINFADFSGTGTSLAALSSGGNFTRIANGTNGQFLSLSGGVPAWVASPETAPGGSTTQVQYNNAGAFGGSSNFVWNGTNVGANGIYPVSTSSGFALRNNAGTAIATIGVGSTSSTSSTWTGNTNITGDWDITGSLDVDDVRINGQRIENTRPGASSLILTGPPPSGGLNQGSIGIYSSETSSDGGILAAWGNDFGSLGGSVRITAGDGVDGRIIFSTIGTTERGSFEKDGKFILTNTTNQIELGTTNTTIINSTAPSADRIATLPDYGANANLMQATTGTFTPVISPATGSFTTLTYSIQYGRYTRKQVAAGIYETTLVINLDISALTIGTASGNLSINIPYTSYDDTNNISTGVMRTSNVNLTAGYTQTNSSIANNVAVLRPFESGDNVAGANITAAQLASNSIFRISITYLSL